MIVYNLEPLDYSGKAIALWEEKGYKYVEGSWANIDKALFIKHVEILIVRLSRRIDAYVLNKLPDLKILVSATTGLDHIDLEEIKMKNIRLISLRGHNDFLSTIPSTAEHTWALLMALVRNIPAADQSVKLGLWNRDQFKGKQLMGKTLGIIGMGRIGRRVAHYAKAFDMKVKYYDPFVNDVNYTKVLRINDLLSVSDILSIHVHLNESTRYLINEKNIDFVKHGSYLINTSRGEVLNETSVSLAVRLGKLGGVAVDVLTHELDTIKKSELWQLKRENHNIIITPHLGGATFDSMQLCEDYIAREALKSINSSGL